VAQPIRRAGVSRSLRLLAENFRDNGELERATTMLEQAVATDTDRGDSHSRMESLHSLGDVALDRRDPQAAARYYREALTICLEHQEQRSQAYSLAGLACVDALNGNARSAGRTWALAEQLETRIGLRMLAKERRRYEDILTPLEGDETFEAARAAGRSAEPDHAAHDLLET
jgi:tetratricopeptide (TPR) repeat protein